MSVEVLKALDDLDGRLKTKFDRIVADQREFGERILSLEQKGGVQPPGYNGAEGRSRTLGEQLVEQLHRSENMELLGKTKSLRFELKAAGDPITTADGRTVVSGGVGAPSIGALGVQNGLPQRNVAATSAVEYSRFTGTVVGAAAQQASEGAAKSAVRPSFTLLTQSAITIAGWTKMSRQALSDSAEMRKAIDITLTREVGKALDAALVNGATGFTGGFNGLATAFTSSAGFTRLLDAISEAVAGMQVAGFAPDVVVLNPTAWLGITTAVGSDGHYLTGNYMRTVEPQARDLRVVLSPSVNVGKALVMDSAHSELLNVGPFAIEVAYDADDFTKNLVTVLGEQRVIPIFRSVGSARLVTPYAG